MAPSQQLSQRHCQQGELPGASQGYAGPLHFTLYRLVGHVLLSCCLAPGESGSGNMQNQSLQHQFFNFVLLSSVCVTNSLLQCCCCEVFICSLLSHQVSLLTLSNHFTVHNSGCACLAFSSPHVSLNFLPPG